MALKYRTQGFVFKKEDRSDSDQSFSVFTRDFGRVELRGRAIRKITSKLRPDIDTFFMSEVEFIQGKHHKTLTDAIKLKNVRLDNGKNALILFQIADVLDSFIKGQEKEEAVFGLLLDVINKIENTRKIKNYKLLYQYFLWNFLSIQGYHLQANSCACCHGKLDANKLYFSAREGGVTCGECARKKTVCKEINSDVVKAIRLILQKDWNIISRLKIEPNSQSILEGVALNCFNAYCPAHN